MKFQNKNLEEYYSKNFQSIIEDNGISSVKMIFAKIRKKARGVGDYLLNTDADVLRYGYRKGLDTLVVHTVNDEC